MEIWNPLAVDEEKKLEQTKKGKPPARVFLLARSWANSPFLRFWKDKGFSTSAEVDRPFAGGSRQAFEKAWPKLLKGASANIVRYNIKRRNPSVAKAVRRVSSLELLNY